MSSKWEANYYTLTHKDYAPLSVSFDRKAGHEEIMPDTMLPLLERNELTTSSRQKS